MKGIIAPRRCGNPAEASDPYWTEAADTDREQADVALRH